MRVLGIDPGSNVTGYGVVGQTDGRLVHLAHGNLKPPRNVSVAARLQHLYGAILEVIERHQPDVAAIEQVFVAASPRSALVLGQARGAVLAAVGARGLCASEFAPAQIKQAVTGSGRASKIQVQRMVRRLLDLSHAPSCDASDALAAAICHAHAGRLVSLGMRGRARSRSPRRGISPAPRALR